eukprot:g2908.t1
MGVGESYGAVDAELPKGKPQVRLEPDDKLHGTPLVSCNPDQINRPKGKRDPGASPQENHPNMTRTHPDLAR